MPLVRFYKAARWADEPHLPQFEVEAGEVREVSPWLAALVVEYGRGEIVAKEASKPSPAEPAPAEPAESIEAPEETPRRGRRVRKSLGLSE